MRGDQLRQRSGNVLGVSVRAELFALVVVARLESRTSNMPSKGAQENIRMHGYRKPVSCLLLLRSQNWSGQLGTGSKDASLVPTPVTGEHINFRELAAGSAHTCGVLSSSKKVACFGSGWSYQLGTGYTTDQHSPVLIADGGSAMYRAVVCGNSHTCALHTNGLVVCFGANNFGQCGDGTRNGSVLKPTAIAGGVVFQRIAAGRTHTCGLRSSDGRAMCWGKYCWWGEVAMMGRRFVNRAVMHGA